MFCPQCRAEYREGFTECADCNVPLVESLPEKDEPEYEYIDYIPVVETYNQGEIVFLKSLLEANEITYYMKNQMFNQLNQLVQPVQVMIAKKDVIKAVELLKDHNVTYLGISTDFTE